MAESPAPSLVYRYQNGLYVNLTSRCPTACRFCIKFSWDYKYRGYDLKLLSEPRVEDIVAAAPKDLSNLEEVVFCGYGEATYRMEEMEEVAREFRFRGVPKIRLNTIGLGSLINGRDITPDLSRFLDAVSISLNTVDPVRYEEVMRPLPQFKGKALPATLQFIRACVGKIPRTVVTAVEGTADDPEAVRLAAEECGALFALRPFLD